ncbi:MAG: PilZ domain-containing protein [Thermodesulfobacteriota bacterium]|nr:PilZ domain-containing protein [Thermodesulfobacteriota bacterium]
MIKLLLYIHDSEIGKKYLNALSLKDVECEVVHSFELFYKHVLGHSYSGLLVDIVSSIRASVADREVLKELMEVYPSLRLRWDPESGDIRTLLTGAGAGQKISIDHFIKTYCLLFHPRALRLQCRKEIHCNVVYSVCAEMPEEATQRTVTLDLSVGGCFLISSHCLARGSVLFLRFLELDDNTPIKVEVQWCREWGKSMNVSGVGVRFLEIQPGQREEIVAMVK